MSVFRLLTPPLHFPLIWLPPAWAGHIRVGWPPSAAPEWPGPCGAAGLSGDPPGEVWVRVRELPTERGAVLGAVVGALAGRRLHLSPLASVLLGALAGGTVGHARTGLSRRPSRGARAPWSS